MKKNISGSQKNRTKLKPFILVVTLILSCNSIFAEDEVDEASAEQATDEAYSEAYQVWLNKQVLEIHSKLIKCKGHHALEYDSALRELRPVKDKEEYYSDQSEIQAT